MPDTVEEIDVRKIPLHKKHSTIFDTYNELNVGESFIITNDHGPKPLGYQMAAVRGEENFSWKYLEKGPEAWKVHIGKTAE